MTGKLVFAVISFLGVFSFAHSFEEVPMLDSLVHETDDTQLTYSCLKNYDTEELDCEFTQVFISHQRNPDDAENLYLEYLSDFTKETADGKASEMFCKMINSQKDKFNINELREKARSKEAFDEQMKYSNLLFSYCDNPSHDKLEILLRGMVEQDTTACIIKTNTWKGSFKRTKDGDWISSHPASGNCLIARTSIFRKYEKKFTDDGPSFTKWKFSDRKTVMNKQGKSEAGISCADWAESEQTYIESEPLLLKCRTVQLKNFWM